MRILVTAGPTQEAIDPVRFLGNRSSGLMGVELARALMVAGHEVVLVHGPLSVALPNKTESLTTVSVGSALEMLGACQHHWATCDALFAVAAVADYRPSNPATQKLKRTDGEGMTLDLIPNPDIVATLAAEKGGRLVLGFALETSDYETAIAEAKRKQSVKHLDWVAANGAEAQGATQSSLTLIDPDGRLTPIGPCAKSDLATEIVRQILR